MSKKGRLSKTEEQVIQDLTLKGKTDKDIAEYLERNIKTIRAYRDKIGLKKTGAGKLDVDVAKVEQRIVSNTLHSDEEKLQYWREKFYTTQQYQRLHEELTEGDMLFFAEKWASYHVQMEDLKQSEEDTLEMLIVYQLRIRKNNKNYKDILEQEDRFKQILRQRGNGNNGELDLEDEADRFLYEQIMANQRAQTEINRELKDLQEKHDKILESLNATRRQREERSKIGANTFFDLVKEFRDRDKREEAGKYAERMRIATKSKMKELKKPHQFMDNTIEPIIMDGSDYIKINKENTE